MIDGETGILSSDENLFLERYNVGRITLLIGDDGI